jgi:hypothetical protein
MKKAICCYKAHVGLTVSLVLFMALIWDGLLYLAVYIVIIHDYY